MNLMTLNNNYCKFSSILSIHCITHRKRFKMEIVITRKKWENEEIIINNSNKLFFVQNNYRGDRGPSYFCENSIDNASCYVILYTSILQAFDW